MIRDESQRILTLTYNNVKQRKDGTWVGTPITVERSINDIIPVDKALNESMLNPSTLANNMNNCSPNLDGVASNDELNEGDGGTSNDETNETISNNEINGINRVGNNYENNRWNKIDSENKKAITHEKTVRRSERIRKQRYDIHPDDIGNNDDEKDDNYK